MKDKRNQSPQCFHHAVLDSLEPARLLRGDSVAATQGQAEQTLYAMHTGLAALT